MRKDLTRTVEMPEGFEAILNEREITIKGNGSEFTREFDKGKIEIKVDSNKVILFAPNASRRESRMIGTIEAHLLNMIKGLQEDFIYVLEICNVHFPMNVKVNGDMVSIKSYLGEKEDRFSKILPGVKVDIKGNEIIVSSSNKELAGQTAANLEKATRPKGRDRRIFQDGIFMKEKCGRII